MLRLKGCHLLRLRFPADWARSLLSISRSRNPRGLAPGFGPGPRSLAATCGIDLSFSSSGYCAVSLRRVSRPPRYLVHAGAASWRMPGCPIRKPPDRRPHASPRGLSQLAASFFACHRQGIRHAPVQSGRLIRGRPWDRTARGSDGMGAAAGMSWRAAHKKARPVSLMVCCFLWKKSSPTAARCRMGGRRPVAKETRRGG